MLEIKNVLICLAVDIILGIGHTFCFWYWPCFFCLAIGLVDNHLRFTPSLTVPKENSQTEKQPEACGAKEFVFGLHLTENQQ